jgi:hypothetical protein
MEGTKISCDHRTVTRELEDTTPIKTAIPQLAIVIAVKARINPDTFTGAAAEKSRGAVMVMIKAAINKCSVVVMTVMINIEKTGMPLIL